MERRLKYCASRLPVIAKERQKKLFAWRAENLITRADFIKYGRSDYVNGLKHNLDELVKGSKIAKDFEVDRCTAIRDFIMVMLCLSNGLRASNLILFSLLVCYSLKLQPD